MTKSERFPRFVGYVWAGLWVFVAYALSSGPVMALAFKLRDATHHDEFYAVMWLYIPLLMLRPFAYFCDPYLGWWCHLFGTTPPG